jgi:DNA helicase II / ATP-dependent DNA helicase PcrA
MRKIGPIDLPHFDVTTWDSFLLHQLIRPYHNAFSNYPTTSIDHLGDHNRVWAPKSNVSGFFFVDAFRGVLRGVNAPEYGLLCCQYSKGLAMKRLSSIYAKIYIDEIQDFGGKDIDLLEMLLMSGISIYMVGDPHQSIYVTNVSMKNKRFNGTNIELKFKEWEKRGLLTVSRKNVSKRCSQQICDLAASLYPELKGKVISELSQKDNHEGLFLVLEEDFDKYLLTYRPRVLIWSKTTSFPSKATVEAMNVGISKGKTFDHVLIVLPKTCQTYLLSGDILDGTSKNRLYIAITRAKFSVAFLGQESPFLEKWSPN